MISRDPLPFDEHRQLIPGLSDVKRERHTVYAHGWHVDIHYRPHVRFG